MASQNATLCHYLLKERTKIEVPHTTIESFRSSSPFQNFTFEASQPVLHQSVFEFLSKQCSSLSETINQPSSQTMSPVNAELIIVITQTLVICFGVLRSSAFHSGQIRSSLRSAELLRQRFIAVLECHDRREEFRDILLICLGPLLRPSFSDTCPHDLVALGVDSLVQAFDRGFWIRKHSKIQSPKNMEQEENTMDMEVEFVSQNSQQVESTDYASFLHNESEADTHAESLYMSIATHIFGLADHLARSGEDASMVENVQSVVAYLTSLSREDFLFSKTAIINLIGSNTRWSDDDADTLLQYMQQVIIKPYELEDSEVAITLCARALSAFTELWTNPNAGDVAATGAELYAWFIQRLNRTRSLSSVSLMRIVEMLFKVMKMSPDLTRTLSLQSTRTTLLLILSEADIPTKYCIGRKLHEMFELFVLNEHAPILEDIIDALPSDPEWTEGIAIRLKILSNLAATWPTLLRRCTYAILETAGSVSSSGVHASICVDTIAKHLNLSSGQELYKLFASQLTFTWLETQALKDLPYAVFDYQTVAHLLEDVQDEVVAQCMMRGKTDEIHYLKETFSKPAALLIEDSFAKISAYSISRDIALPPSDDTKASGAERRVREILGKMRYSQLASYHFADIIAILFCRADHEDQIQKAFDRHKPYANATSIYKYIVGLSHSKTDLPPNQQPSFKAKHLLDQIRHVCSRTSRPFERIWTASLFVHVFRRLIQTIHPALGSLHTCSVLKKTRILICMAGSTVLKGYPLQMVLHAIRPFLHDAHCVDDCIGVLRYLFEAGADQMLRMPSFILAYTVTTLVDMKEFFRSKQDSTTQSSIFQATMSRAQAYYEWVKSYLAHYEYNHVSEIDTVTFKAVVDAACNLGNNGSANSGTYESDLLLAILAEERSGGSLLTLTCKKTVLKSIGHNFQRPHSFRGDVLGADFLSQRYAEAVLNTCRWKVGGPEYLLWAARVLGRSYASHGLGSTMRIQQTLSIPAKSDHNDTGSSRMSLSRIRIIEALSDCLSSEMRHEVGLAEEALRLVVTKSHSTAYALEVQHVLDQDVYDAMLFRDGDINLTTSRIGALVKFDLDDLLLPEHEDIVDVWIRSFCNVLVDYKTDDPLMAALRLCLGEIEGFSKTVFSSILHLVLLSERDHGDAVKRKVSNTFVDTFRLCEADRIDRGIVKTLLASFLYLRSQSLPHENVQADRLEWLELDLKQAAQAAEQCNMYETALLLLEIEQSEWMKAEGSTRPRSKNPKELHGIPNDALLRIYEHLGDNDAYYGVQQHSTLSSVLSRLNHEQLGYKSLSFQSAFFDSQIRRSDQNFNSGSGQGRMTQILNDMSLHGLSQTLSHLTPNADGETFDAVMNSARKLELWSISPPSTYQSDTIDVFTALRKISNAPGRQQILEAFDTGFTSCLERLLQISSNKAIPHETIAALAILTEAEEILTSEGCEGLEEVMSRFMQRDNLLEIDR